MEARKSSYVLLATMALLLAFQYESPGQRDGFYGGAVPYDAYSPQPQQQDDGNTPPNNAGTNTYPYDHNQPPMVDGSYPRGSTRQPYCTGYCQ